MGNELAAHRRLRITDIRPADPVNPNTGFIATVNVEVFLLPDALAKAGLTFDGKPLDVSAFLTVRAAKNEPTNPRKNYILADKPKQWKE